MMPAEPEPELPELGDVFTFPDGHQEPVTETARDWTGHRVNGQHVWTRPPAPARGRPAPVEHEDD